MEWAFCDHRCASMVELPHQSAQEKDDGSLSEELRCHKQQVERERRLFTFVRENLEDQIARMQRSKSWTLTAWLRKGEKWIRDCWPKKEQKTVSVQVLTHQEPVQKTEVRGSLRAVCTIISKNYLAQARAFARSVREHHPDLPIFVLLVDEQDASMDARQEPFELIPLSALAVSGLRELCFRYTIKELNTAMKPFFLEYLLRKRAISCVLYFDPDIIVYSSLDRLFLQAKKSNALLTPHVLTPIPIGVFPMEIDVLRVGLYNLGFIGVRHSATTSAMLLWWQRHLRTHCLEIPKEGYFVDQRWMDLAPILFEGVAVCRDPGCNVAYWNLHERQMKKSGSMLLVGDDPLVFFHFSGFHPPQADRLTSFTCTHTILSQPILRELCEAYTHRLLSEQYAQTSVSPYAFAYFSNGVAIPHFVRLHYQSFASTERFGDPFSANTPSSFYAWLQAPRVKLEDGRSLTNLHLAIHASRVDLFSGFPLLRPGVAEGFAAWLLEPDHAREYQLDDIFLQSLKIDTDANSFIHRFFLKTKRFMQARSNGIAVAHHPHGVNMIGYFTAESGVGQAGRLHAQALIEASVPHRFLDVTFCPVTLREEAFPRTFSAENPYDINLIHVNVDGMRRVRSEGGPALFVGRQSIGYWVWEQSTFPNRWPDADHGLSAVWTPSLFSAQGIRTMTDLPVSVVPHPVLIECPHQSERSAFGLSPDAFVVFFMFDMASVGERKNPLGTIDAFLKAFEGNADAVLVLKCGSGTVEPDLLGLLRRAAEQHKNIRIIEGFLPRSALLDLLRCCDCYLSLHRSEGFGLTIAEAMALGKPVIATDYGGSSEFLNAERGFPVPYALTTLVRDFGVYPKGSVWAEPDLEAAARLLLDVYRHRDEALERGKAASKHMSLHYSPKAIGMLMVRLIRELRECQ